MICFCREINEISSLSFIYLIFEKYWRQIILKSCNNSLIFSELATQTFKYAFYFKNVIVCLHVSGLNGYVTDNNKKRY